MDLVLNGSTFKLTGPVRLTLNINGQRIADKLYTSSEEQTFTAAIPESALRDDGITLVETRLDKYYIAPADGQKLGYIFIRAAITNK